MTHLLISKCSTHHVIPCKQFVMPLEGLEEEGLPKNPDLSLAQLKFLLTVDEVDKDAIWSQLLTAIKENGRDIYNL